MQKFIQFKSMALMGMIAAAVLVPGAALAEESGGGAGIPTGGYTDGITNASTSLNGALPAIAAGLFVLVLAIAVPKLVMKWFKRTVNG